MAGDDITTVIENDHDYHERLRHHVRDKMALKMELELVCLITGGLDEFGQKVGVIRLHTHVAKKVPKETFEYEEKKKYTYD